MAKLYTMCGLPGAGKSTFAENHKECIIVSSDAIRKELYGDASIQGDGKRVFSIVDKRVKEALENGFDVIYDATNLKASTRKSIINKFDAEHICVFVNTPKEECMKRNENRERVVPMPVMERMFIQLTPPTVEEGFLKIIEINV